MEYTRKQTNNDGNEIHSSLTLRYFVQRGFANSLGPRKNKNITRTFHFIGASELFDNLTGFRSLPNDIKGVEGGYDVASITFLQREKEKKI